MKTTTKQTKGTTMQDTAPTATVPTKRLEGIDIDVNDSPEVSISLLIDGEEHSTVQCNVEDLLLPALKAIGEGRKVTFSVHQFDHSYEDFFTIITPRLRPGIRERAYAAWRSVEALRLELGMECRKFLMAGPC